MSLQAFCVWLAATPASQFLQTTEWIVPAVQSVHILSIAVVISAVLMVHLHTLGFAMRSQSSALLAARFLPGLWWALVVLLLSGATLIVAEPERSLQSPMFQLKMLLLIVAITLTLLYQLPLRKDPAYWTKTPMRRTNSMAVAIASLLVWVGIVFAGRWIAYAVG